MSNLKELLKDFFKPEVVKAGDRKLMDLRGDSEDWKGNSDVLQIWAEEDRI